MQQQHHRCNNCGLENHTFRECKIPITSHGIIHYHEGKYLLIRRRKTLGYVDFMRGRYIVQNHPYISNLIDEMTVEEKKDLLSGDFTTLSRAMWNSDHEDPYAREKFNAIKASGVLAQLVQSSTTTWDSQEWGFPKGRRNTYESEINSALREYEEETGYSRHAVQLVRNIVPYEELFVGSNYKSYKHKYYVGFGTPETLRPFQESEVSAIGWYTYAEAESLFRPYNVERKTILRTVDQMIQQFFPSV
jgi:8-oxo-dGTP pyrophosphatase MutT (NUDIX family)